MMSDRSMQRPRNASMALQLLLLLDIWLRLMIWAVALCITTLVISRTGLIDEWSWDGLRTWKGAWGFATTVTNLILLFNVAYLLTLVVVRLPLPRPRAGVYQTDGSSRRDLLVAGLLGVLTKARIQPPFPAVFVPQLASIVPFRWILGAQFGPNTQSSFFLDPNIIDPWGVMIGRNVTIGFGATVTAHVQERDHVRVEPVIIDDDVVVGAYAGIGCGVHIGRGAVVRPYSMVLPGTVIGRGEYWGGVPARRLREVSPAQPAKPAAATSA